MHLCLGHGLLKIKEDEMTSTTPVRDGIYSAIVLESERLPARDPKPPQDMNAEELNNYIKKTNSRLIRRRGCFTCPGITTPIRAGRFS